MLAHKTDLELHLLFMLIGLHQKLDLCVWMAFTVMTISSASISI